MVVPASIMSPARGPEPLQVPTQDLGPFPAPTPRPVSTRDSKLPLAPQPTPFAADAAAGATTQARSIAATSHARTYEPASITDPTRAVGNECVERTEISSADSVYESGFLAGREKLLEAIADVGMSPGKPRKPFRARAIGLVAAAAVLATVAWVVINHVPPPATVPEGSSVAAPAPGTRIRDCPLCPLMTVLPAGRFKQGTPRAQAGASALERPEHWVSIGRPLAMSTNPVTVNEFHQFIAATGRDMQGCDTYDGAWKHRPGNSWQAPGFAQTETSPVTCASWNDAEAYALWLSTTTGHRYRLPTASEWEYAARAGGEATAPWNPNGSGACIFANVADERAGRRYPGWLVFACDDGYVNTSPVGSFKSNTFGLNDMLGNVLQWTQDCWHANYSGAPTDGSARTDGDCSERELRGGSWFSSPAYVRANYRNHFAAAYRANTVGFRVVRDLDRTGQVSQVGGAMAATHDD
jgi:formylglycine-generating enzyme required for sulfatase activity